MKLSAHALSCLLFASFVLRSDALTRESAANPYVGIAPANLFRLKESVPHRPESPALVLPRLYLTGITTILDDKRALLKARVPSQTGQAETERLLILKEGESFEQIEVVAIDVIASTVKVNNRGTLMVLTFAVTPAKPARAPVDLAPPPLPM